MKVYLSSKQDWIDFVNGKNVVAYKESVGNFFKEILVAFNEVVEDGIKTVVINKKY